MGNYVRRYWRIVRHFLSIRGLLQWTGYWETVSAATLAVAVGIGAWINGIPWPIRVTIFLAVFALTTVIWRAFFPLAQPPAPSPIEPATNVSALPARALPARPDIQGEAFNFTLGIHSTKTTVPWSATIHFELSLCNHAQIPTNLKTVELDGSEMNPPATFSEDWEPIFASLREPQRRIERPELRPGVVIAADWKACMEIADRKRVELGGIDLAGLRVFAVDGFGGRHAVGVRKGEGLKP